jgi:hypothetical protein
MTVTTATPTLQPAEQNPWYLLATLYGVPERNDEKRQAENRVAWNRYSASKLHNDERNLLVGRVDPAELRPFKKGELEGVRQQFQQRAGTDQIEMPDSILGYSFRGCHFDQDVFFIKYVFFMAADFGNAVFRYGAHFPDAIFLGPTDFSCAKFSGDAIFVRATFSRYSSPTFANATFSGNANFSSAIFSEHAYFTNSAFSSTADFTSTAFSNNADFNSARFSQNANFTSAAFSGTADFTRTAFSGKVDFNNARFSQNANFTSAAFSGTADFTRTAFSSKADFSCATFCREGSFTGSVFSGDANFHRAEFHGDTIFTNSELKAPTNFENSRFLQSPPRFHGAKLHEGTVWRYVAWPRVPADPTKVGPFIDAYERLKLEMDRLKKHEDELRFFAEELKCRRVERGQLGGWPFGAYAVLCNYGQSYMRPFFWLLAVIVVGAVQFWPALNWDFLLSLALSAANTLAALGLRKELTDPDTLRALSRWQLLFSGAQMVIGPILLFLIGLGLRNRLRMK